MAVCYSIRKFINKNTKNVTKDQQSSQIIDNIIQMPFHNNFLQYGKHAKL